MKPQTAVKKKIRQAVTKKFEGYLFARLHLLGSKSEGPQYRLQLSNGKEIIVLKKVHLWQPDPVLESFLGKKVVVTGSMQADKSEEGIVYQKVMNTDEPLGLDIKLGLKDNTLWINKMPGPPSEFPPVMKQLSIALSVQWPYRGELETERSIWEGECPTSQLYDFWIDDPDGKTIWQWSKNMLFRDKATKVRIPGGSPEVVKVPWCYFEDSITKEGVYMISARFIASEQEVREAFSVQFAV